MTAGFDALIFDLDGVIINTEELHARLKGIIMQQYGISYPETIFSDFKGRPDLVFWQYVAHHLAYDRYTAFELDAAKRKVFFSLANEIQLVPGVLEFIAEAKKKFRHMAMVSSATEPDLMVSDRKFGIVKWFDVIQLGEDTEQHKPHPEPYLKALMKLNIPAKKAIVIEDAPNGIISAKAAGCYVIGITTSFKESELKDAGADMIAGNFDEVSNLIEKLHPVK